MPLSHSLISRARQGSRGSSPSSPGAWFVRESESVRTCSPPRTPALRAPPTGAGEKGRTAHAEGRTKDGDERSKDTTRTREGTSTALLCPAEIVDGKTATPAVQRTVAKLTADNYAVRWQGFVQSEFAAISTPDRRDDRRDTIGIIHPP